MTPIIGDIAYKELSPEEIARFTREAEEMRARAVRAMFAAITRGVAHGVARARHGFRGVFANPGVHPAPRAH